MKNLFYAIDLLTGEISKTEAKTKRTPKKFKALEATKHRGNERYLIECKSLGDEKQ